MGDTYLENADTFEQLELISSIGIPYSPFRHYFKKPDKANTSNQKRQTSQFRNVSDKGMAPPIDWE